MAKGPARAEISRAPLCLLREPNWGKGSKQAHRDTAEKTLNREIAKSVVFAATGILEVLTIQPEPGR